MAGLTVREVDGTPILQNISIIQFDSADGLVLTEPVAGTVRVDYTPAAAPDNEARLLALWEEAGP